MLTDEEWRWIKGYENLYQISNKGRLKSFRGDPSGRIMSNVNINGWYLTCNLINADGKRKTVRIHRLVYETFVGNIPKGFHVHHRDGNKQNNVVANLEVLNPQDHALETNIQTERISQMVKRNCYIKPKAIKQFTLDGDYVAEYSNASIASNYTNICERDILHVANKTPFNKKGDFRKQAGGFIWKFSDEVCKANVDT